MEISKPALILLVSDSTNSWISSSLVEEYEFQLCPDIRDAAKNLRNIEYDLLMMDDALLNTTSPSIIKEIKRLFPTIPIILLSDNMDMDYRTEMMQSGVNAFLTKSTSPTDLHYHVRMLLNQYRQNRSLIHLNRKLHLLASLPRLFYSATDPYALILQAVKLIQSTFRLYGVAVILKMDNIFRIYAGSEEIGKRNKLYESILRPSANDPFLWTIRSKTTQVYEEIGRNPHYTSIPILNEAGPVAIIPLVHQNTALGALAVYSFPPDPFVQEDLMIYEQLGAQLITALHNIYQYQAQNENMRSSQHQLRAWQRFASLGSPQEIGQVLSELVQEIPGIRLAFVWLDTNIMDDTGATFVSASPVPLVERLNDLRNKGLIETLNRSFDEKFRPITLHSYSTRETILQTVFQEVEARQIIAVPISDSIRFLGGILLVVNDDDTFEADNIQLAENLAYTAGVVLERITLMSIVEDKNSRLEAILDSVTEGIIFVDEGGKIAFCNPQVTELTSINSSKLIDQDIDIFLRDLAAITDNESKTLAQLQNSKRAVTESEEQDDYPIVELPMPKLNRELTFEFARIYDQKSQNPAWVGIIRSGSRSARDVKFSDSLVRLMSENLRVPYAEMRSLVATLSDQHGHFSYREREHFLRQIKTVVDHVGRLWNNFLEIYSLETGGVILDRRPVGVQDLVQHVLKSLPTTQLSQQIVLDVPPALPSVKVDEFRVERALSAVLQRALDVAPEGSTITVRAEAYDGEIRVAVRNTERQSAAAQLEHLFDPASEYAGGGRTDFGLYLARELTNRHGGRLWAEASAPTEITLWMALPSPTAIARNVEVRAVLPAETQEPVAEPVAAAAASPAMPKANRVPSRVPNTIMFVEGQSEIARLLLSRIRGEYEVLSYRSGDEALEDVTVTHLDLIIIDTTVSNMAGIQLCKRIREKTEVPIVLVADKVSDADKVLGLQAGADDYITRPISEEELVTRVQVIFKRQTIPERVSEPLVLGNLYIDFARREVFISQKPLDLTRIEYDLLHTLVTNRGRVLSHKELLEKVWGPDYQNETHYLWVNISRLRKKLESGQDGTRFIHTQPGTGYFFEVG